jgi:hypothetical protein
MVMSTWAPCLPPLSENDVIDAVAEHFKTAGWAVKEKNYTTKKGVDLTMTRGSELLLLEAKGGTSLRKNSARYGKPFHNTQQRHHVAEAVYTACKLRSREPERKPKAKVGIAFPNTPTNHNCIETTRVALSLLSVWAYIVHQDRTVEQVV